MKRSNCRSWFMHLLILGLALALSTSTPALADEWTRVYGNPGPDNFSSADAVAISPDGSLYVLGTFYGDFADLTAIDGFDVFVMKLAADGSVVWTKSWDPASMDGTDYSVELEWNHAANRGEIFVDGAGNIGFTIAGFVAFLDADGGMISSSDGADFGGVSWFRQAVALPGSEGGALLATSDASNVAAVSPNLDIEWSFSEAPGFNGRIVGLADGGAVRVFDLLPEFSFQSVAQAVTHFGPDGASGTSILHNERCSGIGPPSAGDRDLEVSIFVYDTSVTVSSRTETSDTCAEGVQHMASYSLETGELGEERPFDNVSAEQSYACAPQSTGVAGDWSGGSGPAACSDASDYLWRAWDLYPRLVSSTGSEYYAAVPMSITNDEGGYEAIGLARFSEVADRFHLETVRVVAQTDGPTVHDVAVGPNGDVAIVGRTPDGSAVLPQGTPPTAGAPATELPQAYVVLNPSTDPPPPPPPPPPDSFTDDDGSIFEADIEWLAAEGITKGCNPPVNDMFCPGAAVTRGQMAGFLTRALGLTDDGGGNLFIDDDASVFEASIDKLATAGITKGCNPPDNTMFCPSDPVTRGQMAAFLVRALGYTDDGGGDLFVDDDGNIFESAIDKLATAGVTRGCSPPVNDQFCPHSNVTRGQMAAFLHRALG